MKALSNVTGASATCEQMWPQCLRSPRDRIIVTVKRPLRSVCLHGRFVLMVVHSWATNASIGDLSQPSGPGTAT